MGCSTHPGQRINRREGERSAVSDVEKQEIFDVGWRLRLIRLRLRLVRKSVGQISAAHQAILYIADSKKAPFYTGGLCLSPNSL